MGLPQVKQAGVWVGGLIGSAGRAFGVGRFLTKKLGGDYSPF